LQIYGEDFAADENATEAASIYDDSWIKLAGRLVNFASR
jgi:hypothetical protein